MLEHTLAMHVAGILQPFENFGIGNKNKTVPRRSWRTLTMWQRILAIWVHAMKNVLVVMQACTVVERRLRIPPDAGEASAVLRTLVFYVWRRRYATRICRIVARNKFLCVRWRAADRTVYHEVIRHHSDTSASCRINASKSVASYARSSAQFVLRFTERMGKLGCAFNGQKCKRKHVEGLLCDLELVYFEIRELYIEIDWSLNGSLVNLSLRPSLDHLEPVFDLLARRAAPVIRMAYVSLTRILTKLQNRPKETSAYSYTVPNPN